MEAYDTEEMERLASRLALLVSEGGEADNAGRAVGSLARKLGLSGGDLKHIFLAGLRLGDLASRMPGDTSGLAREVVSLRRGLATAEAAARDAARERDALRAENDALQRALDNRRSFTQVVWALGAIFVCAVTVGSAMMFVGPSFRAPRAELVPPTDSRFTAPRIAVVRAGGATLRERPDITSKSVAALPAGAKIEVRRLFWNALMQWVQVDAGPVSGYVVTTEIDLE